MTNKKYDGHLTMLRVMRRVFSQNELERMTTRFEASFPGIDLKSLPEYQAAIDAITKYRDAAVAHYDSEYQKQTSGE